MMPTMNVAFMALAFFGLASASAESSSIVATNGDGINTTYSVLDVVWTIEYEDIIPKQNFTGSVQALYDFVNTNYPDYDWASRVAAINSTAGNGTRLENQFAPPRTDLETGRLICGTFNQAYFGYARDGWEYLYTVPGTPGLPAGPATCGRVSCEYDVGIWWCNDNDHAVFLSDYSQIADLAYQIGRDTPVGCAFYSYPFWWTDGQSFHDDGWNVIVARLAGDSC